MRPFVAHAVVPSVVRRQHLSRKEVTLRNRHLVRVVGCVLLAITLLLGFVWTRVRAIQLGYEVTRLHRDVDNLRQGREKLAAEVARLKSPDRLERIAREHLNMRLPQGGEIITMTPEE